MLHEAVRRITGRNSETGRQSARDRRHAKPRLRPKVLLLEDRVLPSISLHIAPLHLAAPKTNTPPGQMVIHKETASPVLASPLSVRTSSQTGTLIPGPGFNGIGLQDEYNQGLGFIPPDTMGVIGPTLTGGKKYFVELINGQFAVFNAVGGALVASESLDTFWSAVSPVGGTSDPHLFYDKQSGRWFATTIDINNGVSGNHWLLAVSQTNDPTGSWFQYKINNINGSSASCSSNRSVNRVMLISTRCLMNW